ncbi:MAG: triose-phosphate isomerase [Bacteroidales bacterium]|nr:triose-phosphate isomerase [Bacteroidales bacterium]
MRTKLVAGNWKMNKTFQEAEDLTAKITEAVEKLNTANVEVILCPPSPYLEMVLDLTDETHVAVGAQNINEHEFGAYTGEISAPMLSSMEVEYCIVGHSERRKFFAESDEVLALKVNSALRSAIAPIFCCGELLPEREAGNHFKVVKSQIEKALYHLEEKAFRNVVIAYEPVWAIGTGVTATPAQAQEMHAFIRQLITSKYGEMVAQDTLILYGGSCNAANAFELFSQADVDGGLIGGASLKAEEFVEIVSSAINCS